MAKFSLQLFLFLLAVGLAVLLVPVDRESMYRGLKNDCFNHASWIYDRIWQNPIPVDIALFGSSRTMNSIDEKLIEQHLPGKQVANFGYCRYGRNLDHILIEDLVEHKKPEIIILEVLSNENPYSHPIAPYLADNKNLFSAYPFYNKDILSDFSLAFRYRLQLLQETLWAEDSAIFDNNPYGYSPVLDTASITVLQEVKKKREEKQKISEWKTKFDLVYPMHYLERIADLCKANNIQLIYLYVPAYGVPHRQPAQMHKLEKPAPVLLPPQNTLNNTDLWFDTDHLNFAGGQELSKWLGETLEDRN